jgi:hypothetical protein
MSDPDARRELLAEVILAESDTEPGLPRALETASAGPALPEGATAVARVVALFGERTDDEDTDPTRDEEAVRLLLALDRPARPPAPAPAQRPCSDGGAFVAYSARARPAARYAGPPLAADVANVIVDGAAQTAGPRDPDPARQAELEAPTVHRPYAHAHPRLSGWIFVTIAGALAIGALAVSLHRAPPGQVPAAPACVPKTIDTASAEPRADASERLLAPTPPSTAAPLPPPVSPAAAKNVRPGGRALAHGMPVAPADSSRGEGRGQFFTDP